MSLSTLEKKMTTLQKSERLFLNIAVCFESVHLFLGNILLHYLYHQLINFPPVLFLDLCQSDTTAMPQRATAVTMGTKARMRAQRRRKSRKPKWWKRKKKGNHAKRWESGWQREKTWEKHWFYGISLTAKRRQYSSSSFSFFFRRMPLVLKPV